MIPSGDGKGMILWKRSDFRKYCPTAEYAQEERLKSL